MFHCNEHNLVREEFNVLWRTKTSEQILTKAYLVVPAPQNQSLSYQTRSQTQRRTLFTLVLRISKRKEIDVSDSESNDSLKRPKCNNRHYCCFVNCNNQRSDTGLSWRKVPKPIQCNNTTRKLYNKDIKELAINRYLQMECLR